MSELKLSIDEYKDLLEGFFLQYEKRNRLSKEEITALANKINAKKDIWFIDEKAEFRIIFKIIMKVDNFLYNNLPNELYDLLRETDKGISEEDVVELTARLIELANKKIDIPYLPEVIEGVILGFIINVLINSLRNNNNIEKSIQECEYIDNNENSFNKKRGRRSRFRKNTS
jgi:hypothetical protein